MTAESARISLPPHGTAPGAALRSLVIFTCLIPNSLLAVDSCETYWTAEYKCMQGCGPCAGDSNTSNGNSGNSGYDPGAAQRAQDAAAARQRQVEADRIERERRAEETRRKEAKFIRDRDAAANTLKGSSGPAINQLKGLSGGDDLGLKGSVFDSGDALKSNPGTANGPANVRVQGTGDSRVVDTRNVPSGLTADLDRAIATAYADAPPGVSERVSKGFQAVMIRDWLVAHAWFQDALNRDPDNPGLKKLVAMTDPSRQLTLPREEDLQGIMETDLRGIIEANAKAHGQAVKSSLQLPEDSDLELLFPGEELPTVQNPEASDVELMFPPDEKSPTVQYPEASDLELMFPPDARPPIPKTGEVHN